MLCKNFRILKRAGVYAPAQKTQVLLAEAGLRPQTQLQAQLRVIAQFRVRVQRQMVGKQVDVVRQQQSQALLQPADDTPVLTAPEQAMVNKNRVGPRRNGSFNQGPAGGHPGDDFSHAGCALHLQTVGAVVTKTLGLEQGVKGLQELGAIGHGEIGEGLVGRGQRLPALQTAVCPTVSQVRLVGVLCRIVGDIFVPTG